MPRPATTDALRSPARRLLAALACGLACFRVGTVHAQGTHLPPRTLTGPNGEYAHVAWRGSRGEFPDLAVSALAEDSLGFLLVASPRGIYRFDGRRFLGPWGFPLNGTAAMAIDARGSLWLATQTVFGLARRLPDGRVAQVRLPGSTEPAGVVDGLTRGPDGVVWFGVDGAIFAVRGGEPTRIASQAIGHPLVVSREGVLWSGANGLQELRGDSLVSRSDLWRSADGAVPTALLFDREGQLWIGGNDGLTLVAAPTRRGGQAIRRFPQSSLGVVGGITALLEDDAGRIWIGSKGGGVSRYANGQFVRFSSHEGLSDDEVQALLQDRTGNIWIGTRGGLDRLRPRAIRNITVKEGLRSNEVWSLAIEPDGSVLVGTDRGLQRMRGGVIREVTSDAGRAVQHFIGAMEPRQDGGLLFGAHDSVGTWRLDARGRLLPWRPPGIAGDFTAQTFLSEPDGSLWVGGDRPALFRVRAGSTATFGDTTGRRVGSISDIARDSAGMTWFAARDLFRIVGDSVERVCTAADGMFIPVLHAGRAGLWFGTGRSADGGAALTLVRDGRCLPLRGAGLPMADVYAIRNGAAGTLWIAGTEGLLRYEEAELARRAVDSLAPMSVRLYDRLDGMQSVEFNSAGDSPSAETRDGLLLFASAGGVVVVDPARLPRNPVPPRPLILAAVLNDSALAVDHPIVAPLGAGTLSFEITAPSLGLPERLRLQYRLDGMDREWVEAGERRTVTYAGLGGGRYTFRLRATNEDGVPSISEAALSVSLVAPFTRTWPFFSLLGGLLVSAGLGVGAVRSRLLARRERELAQLVDRRTRELADARDRLEERVAERTAALAQESAERLKVERDLHQAQKMESVGRLAGGVAHDLNNMLTVILGNADLLREEAGDSGELAQIVSAGERAAHLTSQLLAFARRQVGQPRVLQLDQLVRNIETMLRRLVGEQATLVLEHQDGLWPIWADQAQLEQVLVNLTMNAHDAMPTGGTLTIATSNVVLSPQGPETTPDRPHGEFVQLVVRDTGVGMEPQILAHVFEPFFTTKAVGQGTGLGLASCYGAVKQWDGEIDVSSAPGEGTTFRLRFPRTMRTVSEAPAVITSHTAALLGQGERILLVEDEPIVRTLARRTLQSAGYAVVEATNGEEALAHLDLSGETFALVLSDVVMPRMNGKALADQVLRRFPALPVILMTGYSRGMLTESGLLDADVRVIEKPFTRDVLLAEVQAALRR